MNIKERDKTSKLLKEWKHFLNEDKSEDTKGKIETVGDLKKILDPKNKIKDKAKGALKDTLLDIGIDLVPGGSVAKSLFNFYKSVSNVDDSNKEKLGPLKGLDFDDDFLDFIDEDIIKKLLSDMVLKFDDDKKLSEIDVNNILINTIQQNHSTKISK